MRRKGAMVKPAVKLCTGRDDTKAAEQRQWREMAARDAQALTPTELIPQGTPNVLVPSINGKGWAV